MRIKKYPNGNEFLLAGNMWVRNFTKNGTPYIDINKTYSKDDYFTFLQNETQNAMGRHAWVDTENFDHEKIVIISDGYKFEEKQKLISSLPKDVAIIGVNHTLKQWKNTDRSLTYYLVNNPYPECMKYLPRRNRGFPKCLASTKTNYQFLANYKGSVYKYLPVNEESYIHKVQESVKYQIDDCRNPICGAIQLAYHFGAEKILLLCCDDSFDQDRAGAEKLENGLWQYPQQNIAHDIIDGNLYWLKSMQYAEIEIKNHSSGPIYKNAAYIQEDEVMSFFS